MRTILVVEDNTKISKALSVRLKHAGFTVMTASDAPTALMQAKKREPDLAILDISIPGGNGLDVAESLQLNICQSKLPVIFITANKDPALKESAMKMRPAAFLEKPFSASELLTIIDDALLGIEDASQLATAAI